MCKTNLRAVIDLFRQITIIPKNMSGKASKRSSDGSRKKKVRGEGEAEEMKKPKRLKTGKNANHVECDGRGDVDEEIGGKNDQEDVPHSSGKPENEDQEKELSKIVVCVHAE